MSQINPPIIPQLNTENLVDTHCHINIMIKKDFDVTLPADYLEFSEEIIQAAQAHQVTKILNVGTSLIESQNCVILARAFPSCYAAVGIHPNDLTADWRKDLKQLETLVKQKEYNKIVAIGECGIDKHYPNFDLQRQRDGFKAQIELALEYNLALSIHSRDAYEETLRALEEFRKEPNLRGVLHCFSEDQVFADLVIEWGFVLGIGGTLTYPRNQALRLIAQNVDLKNIVLETDAPYLPPQAIRGQRNSPKYIHDICAYLADLRQVSFELVAQQTTANVTRIFGF
jgi:TatD DNase family protein